MKRKNVKAGEYEELGRALFKRFISASNIPMSELVLPEKGNDLAKKNKTLLISKLRMDGSTNNRHKIM